MFFALQVLIGKHQLAPRLAHVPFDVVSEHAQEDMRADTALQTLVDGTDVQVDDFHQTKRPLHSASALLLRTASAEVICFFGTLVRMT
jgi:hypothetical protein